MKTASLMFLSTLLWASTAEAESLPVWKVSTLSGSERLSFFSLLKKKPKGYQPFLRMLMIRDGLLHSKGTGPQKVLSTLGIRPLVGYDTNLNSGIPADEFALGDFIFRVNKEDQAKAGVTLGMQVFGVRHYSLAPGQVLKFAGQGSLEYAPEHDLTKSSLLGSSCLSSHVSSYTWLDSCAGFRATNKKNASVEETHLSFGGSQAFATSLGHHEATWNVKRAFRSDFTKNYVSFSLRSAIPELGAILTNLTFGQKVDGIHTALRGLNMSLTRPIMGRNTKLSGSYLKSGGGSHFGTSREDVSYTVKISSQLSKNVSASLGYSWTASDIDMYDSENFLFDVNFTSWKF